MEFVGNLRGEGFLKGANGEGKSVTFEVLSILGSQDKLDPTSETSIRVFSDDFNFFTGSIYALDPLSGWCTGLDFVAGVLRLSQCQIIAAGSHGCSLEASDEVNFGKIHHLELCGRGRVRAGNFAENEFYFFELRKIAKPAPACPNDAVHLRIYNDEIVLFDKDIKAPDELSAAVIAKKAIETIVSML